MEYKKNIFHSTEGSLPHNWFFLLCMIFQWHAMLFLFSSVQFGCSVRSDFVTQWIAAHQASLSITKSWSLLKLTSMVSVMHPTISSSVIPFSSYLQSFPASGSFQMSQFFPWGGQSIGVSASSWFLSMNIQDLFPLRLTGWISLQSKGLSRVFSNTTVRASILRCPVFFISPTLTSVRD